MIRAAFMYGNYDGKNRIPRFNIYIGANLWDTFKFETASAVYGAETMIVASADFISVCLVGIGDGAPFISSLALRFLGGLYSVLNTSNFLFNPVRYDLGSVTNRSIRYPFDHYDRMWTPDNRLPSKSSLLSRNTSSNISSSQDDGFRVPIRVMRTFVTPSNGSNINIPWDMTPDPTIQQHIVLHLAEIQLLRSNESRIFDILNEKLWYGAFSPRYLQTDHIFTTEPINQRSNMIRISKAANSTLPPILNAIEVYQVKSFSELATDNGDVDAITDVKKTYHIEKNWIGDPCSTRNYTWEGLGCSYDSSMSRRIVNLSLADYGLSGKIAASFAKLGALIYLNLANNSLSGEIPEALGELHFLQELDLSNNQLKGPVPTLLQIRSENQSLILRIGGNSGLCYGSNSCQSQRKLSVTIIIVIVVIAAAFLLMVAACMWKIRRKQAGSLKPQKEGHSRGHLKDKNELFELKSRQFTFEDLVVITKSFQHAIGKGGFGIVYLGELQDGTQVAVKVNSQSSSQGINEFQAEGELLTRIHHKNLVSLVGYCEDGNYLALVYEYMAQGSLEDHLRGKSSTTRILNWIQRLQIAIEAAQGLEYLHSGCKPPIIHRDVKPSNILLNHKGEAKISDFGVSRIFQGDQTHVSTAVVGTMGYLDPDYFFSCKLTEKSDVYSFGVVLLELITGLPAILRNPDRGQLVHWILASGDINAVIDDRMQGEYDANSVSMAAEIAMKCTLPTSIERPTMSEVVMQLKECLALELFSGTTQIHDTSEICTNCDDSVELSSSTTTTNRRQNDDSELSSAGITTSYYQNESAVSQTSALLHQGCDFNGNALSRACVEFLEKMTILVEQPKTGVADEAKGNGGFVVPDTNSFGNTFRDYNAESERQKTVEEFYRMNHIHQTYDFVKGMREKYGKLDRVEMSIWECIELLNEFVDESDPDLDEPQIEHLLQTAEAIRKDYPNEDWLHLTGLIHDLGKVLLHRSFGELPQWAVVGDTFPVGCAFDECNVHHKHFKENPDGHNPKFNTKFGVYSEGCGLNNVLMSWGHDDYMYLVAKENKSTLPSAGLFIIRYHSFYPLHKHGAYQYLMNEEDKENLKWLHIFKKSKSNTVALTVSASSSVLLIQTVSAGQRCNLCQTIYIGLIHASLSISYLVQKPQLFCKKSTKPTEEKRREKLVHATHLRGHSWPLYKPTTSSSHRLPPLPPSRVTENFAPVSMFLLPI
ncbi:unnamed protein product [Musa banksii]